MSDLKQRVKKILSGKESLFYLLGTLNAQLEIEYLKKVTVKFHEVNNIIRDFTDNEYELTETLKYYADKENYKVCPTGCTPIIHEQGVKARATLKSLGIEGEG